MKFTEHQLDLIGSSVHETQRRAIQGYIDATDPDEKKFYSERVDELQGIVDQFQKRAEADTSMDADADEDEEDHEGE